MVRTKNTPSVRKPASPKPKTPREVVAQKEIRKYQRSTQLLVNKTKFLRLVKGIVQETCEENGHPSFRMKPAAVDALQESSEAFIVSLFESAKLCTAHAHRVTLRPADMQLARRIRGDFTPESGRQNDQEI